MTDKEREYLEEFGTITPFNCIGKIESLFDYFFTYKYSLDPLFIKLYTSQPPIDFEKSYRIILENFNAFLESNHNSYTIVFYSEKSLAKFVDFLDFHYILFNKYFENPYKCEFASIFLYGFEKKMNSCRGKIEYTAYLTESQLKRILKLIVTLDKIIREEGGITFYTFFRIEKINMKDNIYWEENMVPEFKDFKDLRTTEEIKEENKLLEEQLSDIKTKFHQRLKIHKKINENNKLLREREIIKK